MFLLFIMEVGVVWAVSCRRQRQGRADSAGVAPDEMISTAGVS